ncbi:metalloregulator ArsR/SmtB family transcription factor [Clostridium sp. KNHs205]|jgi:ArsR family transcriptional regulator, arsenate/arsenite/antimonite-responsive transcriptional repressor|uniref:ArsR/SmtB family transcription factor n=1 Tax=Clostridium sp. KNHs205 TaxID=1449050 RepID=UPI00051CA1D0|nr:metalloregulator ArsR/SmtB family transcription factor [Clostridium sp. KNHs205]
MVEIFKALSEESRLRILSLILEDELCVCEIESSLRMTQSNASRHLSALKRSGILDSYKNAQWTYYRLNKDFIQENKALWEYLKQKLIELPTFSSDQEAYQKCKTQGLCNCNKQPHKRS